MSCWYRKIEKGVNFWPLFTARKCKSVWASGGLAPWTPTRALPWTHWGAYSAPPDLQLCAAMTYGHCKLRLRRNTRPSFWKQLSDTQTQKLTAPPQTPSCVQQWPTVIASCACGGTPDPVSGNNWVITKYASQFFKAGYGPAENAQIIWRLQRQFCNGKHQPYQVEFALCTALRYVNSYLIEFMGKVGLHGDWAQKT